MTAPAHDASDEPRRPVVVETRSRLQDALATWALTAPEVTDRRAVVMTMGALHEGHLDLVRRARAEAGPGGQVLVTIFVNPLQFGAGEDLDSYPRDLERDVALLAGAGADVVYAPTPDVVYPDGDPIVRVSAGRIGEVLEGAFRPGHLDGVLTVVLKLLHATRPDVALFGQKDAQQLLAVRRMVRDLDLDVEIVGVATRRDEDGLALSSRNAYLSDAERRSALALSRALRAGAERAAEGAGAAAVRATASGILNEATDVVVDYLALVDPDTVEEVPAEHTGPALLLVAARVGTTRLIDNQAVDVVAPSDGSETPGQEASRD
ncbi:pantothenate synthetase [Isoptericola sp. CG 20/1183]|uniref:Pantothenate synthetase n=1 Tax=Isoptericola halotolerans TaxID=300560 RepID=A0ABX5EG08_9MICO|nr:MULTISPECIES: pantoate--beta-alanine ligase [Isoptericola]PRZ08184.1 pantothenate synthetase [Isoptericola halotolerans]PRZ08981.1 pantothenate synthetase [Isoptericola sp. CG 20/1183]